MYNVMYIVQYSTQLCRNAGVLSVSSRVAPAVNPLSPMMWSRSCCSTLYTVLLFIYHCTLYTAQSGRIRYCQGSVCPLYKCIVYSVQYILYSIRYTVYIIRCTVYSKQYTTYSFLCTTYSLRTLLHSLDEFATVREVFVHCTSVQCTLYSVQCTVYSIQYIVLIIQYTVHSVQCVQ